MKKTVRLVSLMLCALMLIQLPLSAGAFEISSMTKEQWDTYYASLADGNTLPTLCVGADETQLNLTWHSDKAAASAKVRLAKNAQMENAVEFTGETVAAENDGQLVCRVTLTGIEENTSYYYQWNTGSGWSETASYTSKAFDGYKALVVGDIQIGGQSKNDKNEQSRIGYAWQNLLDEALTKNPDVSFLLSPGDNTSTGKTSDEWQTLLMPKALRSLPMALAIGNHDKKGFSYNYYTFMPNEYYGEYFTGLDRDFFFRYGDVLYLFFDATSSSAADHMAMAKKAVGENADAKWRVAVMHQALYGSSAGWDPETMLLLNAVFQPIFNAYKVDLVITGHSHGQGRSDFIRDGVVVGSAKSGGTYKNPVGTMYLNSNAVCDGYPDDYPTPWLAYHFVENDVTTYTTLDFSADEMAVKTFRGDNSELLDSITIIKTEGDGAGGIFTAVRRIMYKIVELAGLLYKKIDDIVVQIRGGHF